METNLEAVRNRLRPVAEAYAERFKADPRVRGVAIYGSLARGGLTQFSDVDVAVMIDGELPAYWCEHRVIDGVKADAIFVAWESVQSLAMNIPYDLFFDTGVNGHLLESLFLGDDSTVLHDPTGGIRRVKQALLSATSYQQITYLPASEWLRQTQRQLLQPSRERLEQEEWSAALQSALQAGDTATWVIRLLAVDKEVQSGAQKLGIPQAGALHDELLALCSRPPEAVEAVWAASCALWSACLKRAYEPILERLRSAGVQDPEHLELIGEYDLFWGGNRLHELGRVIAEMDLSYRWCRDDLDHGRPEAAMGRLFRCDRPEAVTECWRRIAEALKAAGYDVGDIVGPLAEDAELRRLEDAMDAALQACVRPEASRQAATRAVELATVLEGLVRGAFLYVTPLEAARIKAQRAGTTAALATALHDLEEAHLELGDEAGFDAFCLAEQRALGEAATPARGGRDRARLRRLSAWRLGAPTSESPTGEPEVVGPDSGWRWTDPGGGASYAFTDDGGCAGRAPGLEITLRRACRLRPRDSTAVTLGRELSGDFALETSVLGWGGILISSSAEGAVYLEKPLWPSNEIRFAQNAGPTESEAVVLGRGRLPEDRPHLRLWRQGDRLRAFCSADGVEWRPCGKVALAFADPIQVAVYAQRWGSDGEPGRVVFGPIRLCLQTQSAAH